jgi:hypothetical protein
LGVTIISTDTVKDQVTIQASIKGKPGGYFKYPLKLSVKYEFAAKKRRCMEKMFFGMDFCESEDVVIPETREYTLKTPDAIIHDEVTIKFERAGRGSMLFLNMNEKLIGDPTITAYVTDVVSAK